MSTAASSTPIVETPQKLMTAEDLFALGTDFHGELVRGRIIEMAPAGGFHGIVAANAAILIGSYAKANKLGAVFAAETGFTIERMPDTVRAPDVAFVEKSRMPAAKEMTGFFEGAPDLAVEVLSPTNTSREITDKVRDFMANGTRLIWIFNPLRRTVVVHDVTVVDPVTLTEADTLTGGDVLPGFSSPVADFFEL